MSLIKHKDQRVGVFIDAQNLYHSAKRLHGRRVNFGNVVKDASLGRQLIHAVAYVIATESGDEKNFFEALTKIGIETKVKNLQIFEDGSKKADWDVGIAVDIMRLAPKLDTIVLVSGDGDFVPLIEYLQGSLGINVVVMAFGKSAAIKLKDVTNEFIDLSKNQRRYLIGRR